MNYTEAKVALQEVIGLLQRDGHFKTSYTTVCAALLNKIAALAKAEEKAND